MEENRRDFFFHPMLVFLIILLGFIIVGGIYLKRMQVSPSLYKQTKFNGFDVSGMTLDQVQIAMGETLGRQLIVQEDGRPVLSGAMWDFGISLDMEGLMKCLENEVARERSNLHTEIENLLNPTILNLKIPYTIDEDAFISRIVPDALKVERVASQDASLKFDKQTQEYTIVPEVYGNEITAEAMQEAVRKGIEEFFSSSFASKDCIVDLPTETYQQPKVKSDDPTLAYTMQVYNQFCRTKVCYTFGSSQEVVGWKLIRSWLQIGDGTYSFDEAKVRDYVAQLGTQYDTRHLDRYFTSTYGNSILIPSYDNEYGYTIDEEAEFTHLMRDLPANETVTREPEYFETNSFGNPYYYRREGKDDLCGTYVECSLSAQHLWFYWNYGLVVESDFVSGDVSKNHQTKTGCFPLAYKESPSVLVGDNANEGDNYRTEVSYWMPFFEGQGLHDATWRGAFGGDIYLTGGSHGCINLPLGAAEMIYSYIEEGVPIVIY